MRLSLALSSLASAYLLLEQRAEAEQWGVRVRDLSVHVQVPLTQVVANQALVAGLEGRDAQAADLADEAVRLSRACRMQELLARSLVLRARFQGVADARADLLEAEQLAQAGGMLDVQYQAARALSVTDPAWSRLAAELHAELLSLVAPGFLADAEPLIRG